MLCNHVDCSTAELSLLTIKADLTNNTDLGVNRKCICNFLLVINSNYGRISYSFRDIDTVILKIARFSHLTLV